MPLDESETNLLKTWVIKKLENISDADSDVLAEYVLALVKTEDPKPAAKRSYIENLQDFLLDNTETFVQDLLQAISSKSFDPSRPPLKPTAPIYSPPKRRSSELPQVSNDRKRSYHDWDREADANGQTQSIPSWERPMKHQRRGGRGSNQRDGRQSKHPHHNLSQPLMPEMPMPPPGMPSFDPQNPMATILAMQQAMGIFPGFPNGASPPNGSAFTMPPTSQRCRDYDIKGFCAAGASCPYEHGNDPFIIPGIKQEYDPNNSTLIDITPTRVGRVNTAGSVRGRGVTRGRGRGGGTFRGGGRRSDFSHVGPNRDKTITSIVIEQIPADKYDEQSIRDFFSEFGTIEEVTMYPNKTLAIVKYDDYEAARMAYESPKVVFDNRFVKVYWYNPRKMPEVSIESTRSAPIKSEAEDEEMQEDEEMDFKKLAKRQEEAQRKHEESRKQREETEKQRLEVDAKLKAMEAERSKIADLIARKKTTSTSLNNDSPTPGQTEDSEQTKLLKAQLAKVEAEAKSLGIDPDATSNGYSSYPSYRGRGGYRGRGRGRGFYSGYRGGWNGAAGRGGAVMRLDNRPKTVAVTFTEGLYDSHDEALRQFLLFNSLDSASLAKHPERDDTALITFDQRYEGENFMDAASNSELLHIGKVELSWYNPNEKQLPTNGTHEQDLKMETATTEEPPSSDVQIVDGYDAPDEEDLDRWT